MERCYLQYAEKKIFFVVTCRIASENLIQPLLVVCGVDRRLLVLNQST